MSAYFWTVASREPLQIGTTRERHDTWEGALACALGHMVRGRVGSISLDRLGPPDPFRNVTMVVDFPSGLTDLKALGFRWGANT